MELTLLKEGALITAARFDGLRRQAEALKIMATRFHLENQRRHIAGSRGFSSISRDGKALGISLGTAGLASVIVGIMSKDTLAAANAVLSTFNTVPQEVGKTDCIVCLDKRLTVVPRDKVIPQGQWVTWESMNAALRQLEVEGLSGATLGNLDSIISTLRQITSVVAPNNP